MSSRESTPTAPRRSQRERKPAKQFENDKDKDNSGSDNELNGDKNDDDHVATDPDSEDEVGDVQPRAPTRGTRGKRGRGGTRTAGTRRKKAAGTGDDLEDGAKLAREAKISDDNPLFNLILSPTTALQDTADNFLESLDNSPANALADLINCVLRCCGCNSSVDSDQVMDIDGVVDALDEFTEGFKTETMPAYPIASRSPIFRKFRKSLAEFITRLVASSAELGSLYASELMPTLQAWIVPLSGSQIRSFRHTATVVALDIETALCQVAAAVDKELQVLSRQKDGERNKKAGRSKAREQELDTKTKEVNARRAKLKEYLKDIFNAVFVHRSRDHDAAIRADCVHELGVWFTKHPSYFLESGFLPYLGKTLSDQNASVRLEAARSINTLYSKKDYIVAVNHFTQTFKPRLIEMAVSDTDLSVRVNVIQVLLGIAELGLLEDEEREQLCLLVFGAEPRVRNAVAPFVKQAWADEVDQHLVGRSMTKDRAETETQRAGAKCLASLLIKWSKMLNDAGDSNAMDEDDENSQGETDQGWTKDRLLRESGVDKTNHDRIGLAVEALWEEMPFIQKWNGLLNLLLMDHTSEVEPVATKGRKKKGGLRKEDSVVEEIWRLSEQEEEVLLDVLVAALRRATEEAKAHQKTDKAVEADDEEASLDDITLVLIKALPRLFIKHQTDASRISNVLVIPQLMNVGMYLEMRLITAYETLWDDVSKQLMNHPSETVIRRAVQTIRHLLSTTSLQNTNKKRMGDLEEELGGAIRERVGDRAKAGASGRRALETATLDEEEIRALTTLLYRVSSLINIKDMVIWVEDDDGGKEVRLVDVFTSLVERAKLGNKEEDKMIELVISILNTYLLWKTQLVLSDAARPGAEDHALRQALKQQRDSIVDALIDFVVGEDSQVTESVKRAAFLAVMNIHLVYSLKAAQRPLADLQMSLEEEAQFRLAGYIQAVIEEYADGVEEERKARQKDSDTEMDSDTSPAKPKKRGRKKKVQEDASSPLGPTSQARIEKDYMFHSGITPFIQAIHSETISFEHAAVILTHYGRFGTMYDQLSKVLAEMMRNRWQAGDNDAVAVVVQNSMRGAFNLYLNEQTHSDEASVSLARLFATYFIHRGAHLTVLGRLPSKNLLDIHKDLINYLVRKLKHNEVDEEGTARVSSLFRGLMHLVATGTPTDETMKLKEYLDAALEKAGIEWSSSNKLWDGLRVYEKKLTNAPKEKVTTGRKRGRPKKGAISEEEDLENAATDDDGGVLMGKTAKQVKPRARPIHRRGAKDRASGSSAASSEVEAEPEPPVRKPKAKDKPAGVRKRKALDEDEEEPDDALLVLNGNETPSKSASKSTPFQSATKGSARKRRRGSEEPGEESPSIKKRVEKTMPLPVTNEDDDDDDNFIGRKLKRIKR